MKAVSSVLLGFALVAGHTSATKSVKTIKSSCTSGQVIPITITSPTIKTLISTVTKTELVTAPAKPGQTITMQGKETICTKSTTIVHTATVVKPTTIEKTCTIGEVITSTLTKNQMITQYITVDHTETLSQTAAALPGKTVTVTTTAPGVDHIVTQSAPPGYGNTATVYKTVHDTKTISEKVGPVKPPVTVYVTKVATKEVDKTAYKTVTRPASVIIKATTVQVTSLITKEGKVKTVVTAKPTTIIVSSKPKTIVQSGSNIIKTITAPASTITQTKLVTSVQMKNITLTRDGKQITKLVPTTIVKSQPVTIVKTQKGAAEVQEVTTTAPGRRITVYSTLPGKTIVKDHTVTSKITCTAGQTVTIGEVKTVVQKATTIIRTSVSKSVQTLKGSTVSKVVTTTKPGSTILKTLPAKTITKDHTVTQKTTCTKGQQVTINNTVTKLAKPTTLVVTKVQKSVQTLKPSVSTKVLVSTKQNIVTMTYVSRIPASTITQHAVSTKISTCTEGQTVMIRGKKTVLAKDMPTTLYKTSIIKTTLPAHDRTITQKGETKIFVSTIPASTVTAYKTLVSTTVCSKGQTVTMPGGSTTVMAQASTLTTTATSQLYSTVSAQAATVTRAGSTVYRDVVQMLTVTCSAGQTVTINNKQTVYASPTVITTQVTSVSTYVPSQVSTAVAPVQTSAVPVPDVLPKCVEEVIKDSSCNGTSSCSCYCKSPAYTTQIINCITSSGGSSADVSEAVAYFQGLCAPYVSQNPAIITAVPSTVTAAAPAYTQVLTTVQYSSKDFTTTMTAPALTFYTPTPTGDDDQDTPTTPVIVPNVVSPTAEAEAESTDAADSDDDDDEPTTQTATIPVDYASTGISAGVYSTTGFAAYNAAGKTVLSGAMGGLLAAVAAVVAL